MAENKKMDKTDKMEKKVSQTVDGKVDEVVVNAEKAEESKSKKNKNKKSKNKK